MLIMYVRNTLQQTQVKLIICYLHSYRLTVLLVSYFKTQDITQTQKNIQTKKQHSETAVIVVLWDSQLDDLYIL